MGHTSFSQINMYSRCGEQYRRRYIEGERVPPGIALHRGTGVHKGAEHNFSQKIESREDLPKAEIVDAAVAGFDDSLERGDLLLSREEKSKGKNVIVGDARDATARLAGVLADDLAPTLQPILVEERAEISIGPTNLLGYIDLVTEDEVIHDLKTSAKSPVETDVAKSGQMTAYTGLYAAVFKRWPQGAAMDYLVDTKTPKAVTIQTARTKEDVEAWLKVVEAVLNGIEAEIFLPAPEGSWACSERFCGYWATCPYVSGSARKRVIDLAIAKDKAKAEKAAKKKKRA